MGKKNRVKFFTKALWIYAYFSLFMTTVVSGVIIVFNLSDNVKFYYYSFYAIYNAIFIILILIRIPFYIKEKSNLNIL